MFKIILSIAASFGCISSQIALARPMPNLDGEYTHPEQTVEQAQVRDSYSASTRVISRTSFVSLPGVNKNAIGLGASLEKSFMANFYYGARIDYWRVGLERWGDEYDFGASDLSLRDFSLGGYAKYVFPVTGSIKPFASFGLGYHMLKLAAGSSTVGISKTGFDIGLGSSYTINKDWTVEGQFSFRNMDQLDYTEIGLGLAKSF